MYQQYYINNHFKNEWSKFISEKTEYQWWQHTRLYFGGPPLGFLRLSLLIFFFILNHFPVLFVRLLLILRFPQWYDSNTVLFYLCYLKLISISSMTILFLINFYCSSTVDSIFPLPFPPLAIPPSIPTPTPGAVHVSFIHVSENPLSEITFVPILVSNENKLIH